jgi:hypothetical protein
LATLFICETPVDVLKKRELDSEFLSGFGAKITISALLPYPSDVTEIP